MRSQSSGRAAKACMVSRYQPIDFLGCRQRATAPPQLSHLPEPRPGPWSDGAVCLLVVTSTRAYAATTWR